MWGRPGVVLAVSAAVGVLQLLLAYWAGVHADVIQGEVHRFGYLRSLNWSVMYLVVTPIILAACVPATIVLYRLSKAGPAHRIRFYVLAVVAVIFAVGMAGVEGWRAWAPMTEKPEFLQWNSFNADVGYPYASPMARACHIALFWVGYAHYFAACFFGLITGFGVPWYFAVIARPDSSVVQLRDMELGLLSSLRTAVVGYLLFLAVLRISKTSMHLQTKGIAVEIDKVGELLKGVRPYFEFISQGLILNVILGFFWVALAIGAHYLAWRISTRPKNSGFIQDLFLPVAGAYELLGASVRFWVGICLVAIVLPPPGFQYLVALSALIGGLYLVKSSHSR